MSKRFPNGLVRLHFRKARQRLQNALQSGKRSHVSIAGCLIGNSEYLSCLAIRKLFKMPQCQNFTVDFVH